VLNDRATVVATRRELMEAMDILESSQTTLPIAGAAAAAGGRDPLTGRYHSVDTRKD
jgi:hypothetical protein